MRSGAIDAVPTIGRHMRKLRIAVPLMTAACGLEQPPPVVVPPGAQVVHVTVTEDSVQLVPASVQAGDVYLVLEGPNPSISFVGRMEADDARMRGMDKAQVRAVAQGDFRSTGIDGISVSCEVGAWTEARHWEGCGENVQLTLAPGFYVVLPGSEDPGVAPVMAVLEVSP